MAYQKIDDSLRAIALRIQNQIGALQARQLLLEIANLLQSRYDQGFHDCVVSHKIAQAHYSGGVSEGELFL